MLRTALAGAVALTLFVASSASAASAPQISVLSNRADILSGGDALLQVVPAPTTVSVDGHDVTSAFGVRPDGRYMGLLTGLSNGDHTVTALASGGRGARLKLAMHPLGGPVTAGPQIQPWACCAGATDPQCNRPVS